LCPIPEVFQEQPVDLLIAHSVGSPARSSRKKQAAPRLVQLRASSDFSRRPCCGIRTAPCAPPAQPPAFFLSTFSETRRPRRLTLHLQSKFPVQDVQRQQMPSVCTCLASSVSPACRESALPRR